MPRGLVLGDTRCRIAVALLALAGAACSKGDPSGPTSVYLSIVNGPGLAVPDELRVTATGDGGPVFEMQRLPASGPLVPPPGAGALLGTVTLYVGGGVRQLAVDVRGYDGGVALSEGTTSVGVAAGKQVQASVVLARSAEADGGATDAEADAADAGAGADGASASPDAGADAAGGDAASPDVARGGSDAPSAPDGGAPGCAGSAVSGTTEAPVSPVNLTTEGTLDWRHWGAMGYVDFKAISRSLVSDYTLIGAGPTMDVLTARGGLTFEWTDGSQPRPSATTAPYSVGVLGNDAGFAFTVPATAATQTLDVYVSGQNDATTFTASLDDGCGLDYTRSRSDTQAYAAVHHVTFESAVPGALLRVSWVMSSGSDPIGLYAAALH
jgi:hypothetical protein